MRAFLVLLSLATPLVAQEPPAPAVTPVPAGDLAKFQGFWKPESVRYDGAEQLVSAEQRKLLTLVVKGSEYRMYVVADAAKDEHFRMLTADLTLAQGSNAFEIAVKSAKAPAAGEQKRHGVYEFRGDKLVLCYAETDRPRPTSFAAEKGSGQFLEVWVREPK